MKGIRIIPMQIGMIGKRFKACESKFESFQTDLKHLDSNINANFKHFKGFEAIAPFVSDSNQSNGNSND